MDEDEALKGLIYVSHVHATQRGLRTPYVLADPRLSPLQVVCDVRLPKNGTFRRGDAAARAVIGPLTKARRRTIRLASKRPRWVVALRERRTWNHNQPFRQNLEESLVSFIISLWAKWG